MSGALQGVKVLEIGSYVTGPYAGMLLGDLGAEVIKVENKPYGDPFRGWGRTVLNPTFCSLNRNKKSITLNLKTNEARDIFLRLADDADVIIENLRPGSVDGLGIGYEMVRARNPRIVYCSIWVVTARMIRWLLGFAPIRCPLIRCGSCAASNPT